MLAIRLNISVSVQNKIWIWDEYTRTEFIQAQTGRSESGRAGLSKFFGPIGSTEINVYLINYFKLIYCKILLRSTFNRNLNFK